MSIQSFNSVEDQIVELNHHRRNLFNKLDEIPLESLLTDDLNDMRQWILETIAASKILTDGLTPEIFEEFKTLKEDVNEIKYLEEENKYLENQVTFLQKQMDKKQKTFHMSEHDDEVIQTDLDENEEMENITRIEQNLRELGKQRTRQRNTQPSQKPIFEDFGIQRSQVKKLDRDSSHEDLNFIPHQSTNIDVFELSEKCIQLEEKLKKLQGEYAVNERKLYESMNSLQQVNTYSSDMEKDLEAARIELDSLRKEKNTFQDRQKLSIDLIRELEDEKQKLERDNANRYEQMMEMQDEYKALRDKYDDLQEYLNGIQTERKSMKFQFEGKDKKIKDLESVINNFATIQEHLVYKKTKKREQFNVEKIEEIFKQIQEEEKQRLYEEAINSLKKFEVVLSPRNRHVTLKVTDHEENVTQHKIQVTKNDLDMLDMDEDDQAGFNQQLTEKLLDTSMVNRSFGENQLDGYPSDDKSDNNIGLQQVNLRPFEFHSNTTSADVSRRGSFLKKGNAISDNASQNNRLTYMNEYENTPFNAISGEIVYTGHISDNVSRPGSFYKGEKRNSHRMTRPVTVQEQKPRKSTLNELDFDGGQPNEHFEEEQRPNDLLDISYGDLSQHSLMDVKPQVSNRFAQNIFTEIRIDNVERQEPASINTSFKQDGRKSSIQTPMFSKNFQFRFDDGDDEIEQKDHSDSDSEQSEQQSKSLIDITQGCGEEQSIRIQPEAQKTFKEVEIQTEFQEIQEEHQTAKGSKIDKLIQQIDVATHMLPEDIQQFLGYSSKGEEYKMTPRDKRKSQVVQDMDMYLDGEDLVLRSPLSFRRANQITSMPKKKQIKDSTMIQDSDIVNNRNSLPTDCSNQCSIY